VKFALIFVLACHVDAPKSPPPEKSLEINKKGEMVDIDAHLEDGYVTVIDFWADWCGGCTVVGGMLAVGVAKEPSVVVRKIDVGEGTTAVAHAYQVNVLPHFRIYDKHKRLRYELVANACLKATELAHELAIE
jgi:thiol-disulfide isomerase/thioredoxin